MDPRSYFPAVNEMLTPIDLAHRYYAQQLQNEINRQRAMNEIPSPSAMPVAPITTAAAVPASTPAPVSHFAAMNTLGTNLVYRPNPIPTPQPISYFNPVIRQPVAAANPNFSF